MKKQSGGIDFGRSGKNERLGRVEVKTGDTLGLSTGSLRWEPT